MSEALHSGRRDGLGRWGGGETSPAVGTRLPLDPLDAEDHHRGIDAEVLAASATYHSSRAGADVAAPADARLRTQAIPIAYRALQNGFDAFFVTAAAPIARAIPMRAWSR